MCIRDRRGGTNRIGDESRRPRRIDHQVRRPSVRGGWADRLGVAPRDGIRLAPGEHGQEHQRQRVSTHAETIAAPRSVEKRAMFSYSAVTYSPPRLPEDSTMAVRTAPERVAAESEQAAQTIHPRSAPLAGFSGTRRVPPPVNEPGAPRSKLG